ncbi:7-cyano-7-deazaguanine synthase [Campylobacter magnus]|uniref:7-cyano-7-deazaguanine synthase n=1 Tax=Campylobacter magnus TaxID=3026462 RepID=UPI00236007B8|nr:7-cyano-7-deazaguanine synthase [Campylobacter magnus]MDD0856097.1 7-cyano-7-deazaguanine synthase [Campylobacter magnus]
MKALALFSGGLDSMLAIKLITNQGIEVHALHFDIGFSRDENMLKTLERRAAEAGASFERVNITNKYLRDVLFSPKYGYGKAFNPCIDCHGYMFKTAICLLEEHKASFVISGEVLGQRPMSQRNEAMNQVKKLSGNGEIILRPLCAKLLPPSLPELRGFVDREKLEAINGRSRARQTELATLFGFSEWASPGGGCPYTDQGFSARIQDWMAHEGKGREMDELDLQSLRYGRHLRLENGAKLIIGRDERENNSLLELFNSGLNKQYMKAQIDNFTGAFVLVSKSANESERELSARFALTYGKSENGKCYEVKIGDELINTSAFASKDEAKKYLVG